MQTQWLSNSAPGIKPNNNTLRDKFKDSHSSMIYSSPNPKVHSLKMDSNKLCYTHAINYCTAMKLKELKPHATIWNFIVLTQSVRRQVPKNWGLEE